MKLIWMGNPIQIIKFKIMNYKIMSEKFKPDTIKINLKPAHNST